jgi:hypothetical protein
MTTRLQLLSDAINKNLDKGRDKLLHGTPAERDEAKDVLAGIALDFVPQLIALAIDQQRLIDEAAARMTRRDT